MLSRSTPTARADAGRPDGDRPDRRDHARLLAAEQGGRPARLPAVRGRHRGVGAAGHRRRAPARSSTVRSTAPATPPRLAARRQGVLLRPPAAPGAGAGRRGAVPPPGLAAPAGHRPGPGRAGLRRRPDKTNYYYVRCAATAAGCWSRAEAGTAPRNDVWVADLSAGPTARPRRPTCGCCSRASTRDLAAAGRDGRIYLFTDRDAPRGRVWPPTPVTPRSRLRELGDLLGEDPEAVLDGFAILDGGLPEPVLLAAWTRHAVCEITVHDLVDRPAVGPRPAARPRHRRRPRRASRGRARGVVRLHRPRDAVVGAALRRPYRRRRGPGQRAPGQRRRAADDGAQQVAYSSADGTTVRMLILVAPAAGGRARRGRPSCTATAASASRSTPGLLGDHPRLGRGRRRLRRSRTCAAAARTARTGTATGMLGPASRTSSTTSTRRPSGSSRDGWTTPRPARRSWAAPTAACWSARPSPSGPTLYAAVVCSAPLLDMVRYELFGLGADVERTSTARRPMPGGVRLAARLLAVPPRPRRRSATRRCCSPSSTATPGSTRCTRASSARRCSTRPARRPRAAGPAAAGAGRRPRRQGGEPLGRALGRRARVHGRPDRTRLIPERGPESCQPAD